MAHKKAGGAASNLNDSQPKYLGVKKSDGSTVKVGNIIVRQRGSVCLAGENTKMGKDHTIFAIKAGTVAFGQRTKQNFDGTRSVHKEVTVK